MNLVVWRRRLRGEVRHLASRLARRCPDLSVELPGDQVLQLASGMLPRDAADLLGADFARLVGFMRGVVRGPLVARLKVVVGSGSPRFHADGNRLRLICTYAGSSGTEWVPDAAIDRDALATVSGETQEANLRIVRSRAAIRRTAVGDVLVMKGEAWPGFAARAAVHRSPPAGPRDLRLVLRITARRQR